MMKKIIFNTTVLGLLLGLMSCSEERPTLGPAPSEVDAAFYYEASTNTPNIISFTAQNPNINAKWDFGNGTKGEGVNAQGSYPYAGTYIVTLTIFDRGGSASTSQTVTIAEDDLSLISNPLYTLLTGGINGPGYKAWVMDTANAGHFGVGPNPSSALGDVPEYYAANPGEKAGTGMYDDQYIFKINGFKFDHITNGNVFVNLNDDGSPGAEGEYPGGYQNSNDYTAPLANQYDETWKIEEGENDTTLTLSGKTFIGMYCGTRKFKIVKIEENVLLIRAEDAFSSLAWYFRLVPVQ